MHAARVAANGSASIIDASTPPASLPAPPSAIDDRSTQYLVSEHIRSGSQSESCSQEYFSDGVGKPQPVPKATSAKSPNECLPTIVVTRMQTTYLDTAPLFPG